MVALKNQNQCFKTFFLHSGSLTHGGHPQLKKCETKARQSKKELEIGNFWTPIFPRIP